MQENETIIERLKAEAAVVETRKKYPPCEYGIPWVKDNPAPTEEMITVTLPSELEHEVEVTKQTQASVMPKRLLEMVAGGMPPSHAAKKLGTSLAAINPDGNLRAKLKKVVEEGRLPDLVRKEMVRAGLNKIFLQNVDGSTKEQKLAIAAAKEIGKDPEVGLNLPNVVGGVVVDLSKFGNLIQNMKPIPGLEEAIDVTVVVDGDSHDNETATRGKT